METLIDWMLGLAFPVGCVVGGWVHFKRHPEAHAAYIRQQAGRDTFGSDSWGGF